MAHWYQDGLLMRDPSGLGVICTQALACGIPPGPQGTVAILSMPAGTISRVNYLRMWLLSVKIAHDERNVAIVPIIYLDLGLWRIMRQP